MHKLELFFEKCLHPCFFWKYQQKFLMNIKWNPLNELLQTYSPNRINGCTAISIVLHTLKVDEKRKELRHMSDANNYFWVYLFGAWDSVSYEFVWSILIWNSSKMSQWVFCFIFTMRKIVFFCRSIEKCCPSHLIININY